jgi:hypothetical protein
VIFEPVKFLFVVAMCQVSNLAVKLELGKILPKVSLVTKNVGLGMFSIISVMTTAKSGDEHLCRAAEQVDGEDDRFGPLEMKVGCYCYDQNCFGKESGIGCWWFVKLMSEKGNVPDEGEPGVSCFDCSICKCNCQATFRKASNIRFWMAYRRMRREASPSRWLSQKSKGEGD